MTYAKRFRTGYGFTLVELMITLVISSIIVAAVYAAYKSQRDTFEAQDQVTEIQQNLRNAMWHMTRMIRMAGYDPQGTGDYKIRLKIKNPAPTPDSVTGPSSFLFEADMCKDGGAPASCAGPPIQSPEVFYFERYKPDSPPPDYPFPCEAHQVAAPSPNTSIISNFITPTATRRSCPLPIPKPSTMPSVSRR